jgi:Secretion system C-terminal sorting domain
MKKLYTLFLSVAISSLSFGQNAEIYTYESVTIGATDISGTQVDFTVTTDGTYTKHFYMKNVSGSTNDIKLERTIVSEPAGWDDYLCWGRASGESDPLFQNNCYGASQMNSTVWLSPNIVTIPSDSGAEVIADYIVNGPGTACYKYVFKRGGTRWDSLNVCINRSVSIDENEELSFAVYPNPANDVINISTKGTDGNSTIRITDVLGKVVLQESINENKKLDVSDFKNGVYLINVIENGISTKSKRIVVRH